MLDYRSPQSGKRKAVILVIVVAMLGLFLSIGLAFVFYANQQAVVMRIHREAAQGGRSAYISAASRGHEDESPPMVFDVANTALGQLIYDVPDNELGIGSALRGGSLSRTMYGLFYDGTPQQPIYSDNTVPYNGIGRYRSAAGTCMPPLFSEIPDANVRAVNYTYFANDGFVRDPERLGFRTDRNATAWNVDGQLTNNNYFPLNAPYTYPDEKDISLAALRASDGRVLVPSFYRPSAFGSLAPDNPNWKNAVGKYLIHRPRPCDMGPGFPAVPANADGTYTGDIEQLEGKQVRQNDSLWLDLDLPVHRWQGREYKPLVAFLVIDLDGRININVAGNRRGIDNLSASNQGWGPWEGDLNPLFPSNEAKKLFLDPAGRYGTDATPNRRMNTAGTTSSENAIPCAISNPFYAQIDFDGSMMTKAGGQSRMQLPQAPSTRTSPIFSPRYAGGSLAERSDHPLLFNPYLQSSISGSSPSGDRTFSPNEMRWLNCKFNGDDGRYQQAELGRLFKDDLGRSFTPGRNGWPSTGVNPRFAITTLSHDLDRVGLMPWLNSTDAYVLEQPALVNGSYPSAGQPRVADAAFPPLTERTKLAASPAATGDFDPKTWKARHAGLGAVDLARPLVDYREDPTQPYETPGNVSADSARRALEDRQRFAKSLFDRLCIAAGANLADATPGTGRYHALRYLAQLAANMVDYLDSDDYVTSFVWNPVDSADPRNSDNFSPENLPQRVVFGTELPRLVINEACMRVENGAMVNGQPDTDPGLVPQLFPLGWLPRATFYNVKIFAELHNPLSPGSASVDNLAHSGGAPLTFGGHQVYRLLLSEPNRRLRHVENVTGAPDGAVRKTVDLPDGVYSTVAGVIPPSNGAYVQPRGPGSSFYVIGPEPTPGDLVIPSATSDNMKFRLQPEQYRGGEGARTTLLLQRLACPPLPQGPDNPFLTIDVMDFTQSMINDARLFDERGLIIPPPLEIILQRAYGRKQPYAGHPSQIVAQNIIPAPVAGFNHTFFRHNGQGDLITKAGLTLTQPFDWLVHLDREPVSPVELLHLSAYKPHELTQQFLVETLTKTRKFQHCADWLSDASRLHRALAFLQTRNRTHALGMGGRVPGRVNINTIWDEPVFQAIAAANSANNFTTAEVAEIWRKAMQSRSPSGAPSQSANLDRPFGAFGPPIDLDGSVQFPTGSGIANTWLRPDPADPGKLLWDTDQSHPYLKHELLNKVHGQLTTRSNVFAVWMTVGYFEVTDRTSRPMKLGNEIGISSGTSIRHRFFALIDRTNLAIDSKDARRQGCRPVFFSFEPMAASIAPGEVTVTIPAQSFDGAVLRGTYDDAAWELRVNDRLWLDVGPDEESVTVQTVSFQPGEGARLGFTCTRPHSRGSPIQLDKSRLGNPGPQPRFNVRDSRFSGVVRLFVMLD